jgi:hypothetical protein
MAGLVLIEEIWLGLRDVVDVGPGELEHLPMPSTTN